MNELADMRNAMSIKMLYRQIGLSIGLQHNRSRNLGFDIAAYNVQNRNQCIPYLGIEPCLRVKASSQASLKIGERLEVL